MGKNTHNFRQSIKSRSGNRGAQTYSQVNRTAWHAKFFNWVKVRGKGGV